MTNLLCTTVQTIVYGRPWLHDLYQKYTGPDQSHHLSFQKLTVSLHLLFLASIIKLGWILSYRNLANF